MSLLLGKISSQLLLPPGGVILLGVVGLIFWKRWWGRGLVFLALASLWLLSTEPVRDMLSEPLEYQYTVLDVEHVDREGAVIVLLGGGINENAPEYQGRDGLGRYAVMRTLFAADIARKSDLDIYATGGKPLTETADPEGEIMRRFLLRLGLSERKVFAESASNNTWENAAYMQQMLADKGVERVVLVTSAWHMPRAVWCFEANGMQVIPAPTDFITKQGEYDARSYFPRWTVLADSGQAMHEYLGLLWYRMRYGE